ncbi:MAG: ATP-binding protein [Bacteroidetes bacterium]|nr:ATP-binding protein [Bacteroidota bacterium]
MSCKSSNDDEKSSKKEIDSIYNKAVKHIANQEDNKAFYEFNLAKDGYLKLKDSSLAARSLTEMAIIQEYRGDNLGSIETSIAALKLVHEKNNKQKEIIFDNYINLGTNSTSLEKYEDAEKAFKKSLNFVNEEIQLLRANHNLAIIYFKEKKYKKAKDLQNSVLSKISKKNENYYKVLINSARYTWYENPTISPVPILLEAEKHYLKINDNWGLLATYSYLSEFYAKVDVKISLYYSKLLYKVSKKVDSPLDELEALEKISELDPEPKKYFVLYIKKSDSLTNAINKSKNQFAIIRYESEKNLSNNIKLEKDIGKKNYILFGLFVLLISSIAVSYIWVMTRKKQLILLTDNKIKEERLVTSKKVHDVVANGLYQIMTTIEHNNSLDREHLLDKLEDMYQKSRDISYDEHLLLTPSLMKIQISELGSTFQNNNRQVFIVGNDEQLWEKIPDFLQENLYQILQELFINTKKHSFATRIVLKFEIIAHQLIVTYKDNGMINKKIHVGNGISNIIERINTCNGKVLLPSENGFPKEFEVKIEISLNKNV